MTFRRGGGDTSGGYEFRRPADRRWSVGLEPRPSTDGSSFLKGDGASICCSPTPYKTRVAREGLERKEDNRNRNFYYSERSMDPLLMSPVFTFRAL